jgi:hypothetical protein
MALQPVHIVKCKGSSAKHDSAHVFDASSEPIVGSSESINFLAGGHFLQNVEKASSWDAAIYHPALADIPALFEEHQYKHSEANSVGDAHQEGTALRLRGGKYPLVGELAKVSNDAHDAFRTNIDNVLVVISTKPFTDFARLQNPAILLQDLPSSLIVISHETLLVYLGPVFAHRGFYRPRKRELDVAADAPEQTQRAKAGKPN